MGTCIICGTSTDGRICDSHEEDVVFEFKGTGPSQLRSGRFYRGTVDGYADFGVFVDLASDVTGLLHRSELDQRLESLDWEPGDTVFVQVKNVRDNGNVDLSWSIRQAEREFRGSLVHDGETEREPTAIDDSGDDGSEADGESDTSDASDASETTDETDDSDEADEADGSESEQTETVETSGQSAHQPSPADDDREGGEDTSFEFGTPTGDASSDDDTEATETDEQSETTADDGAEEVTAEADETDETDAVADEPDADETDDTGTVADTDETDDTDESEESDDRATIDSLDDHVDEDVRLEGEITDVRQTSGPTVFELRDETGTVDCAAFVEAGVRAYPGIETGEIVRLDGEVEMRREELQVETEAVAALEGEDAEAVTGRLAEAMRAKTRPDEVRALAEHPAIDAVEDELLDAAEAIHRAVLSDRPIVVRHAATADGYVAGAAVERAALPLVRSEHPESDAEYHYFDRRPLDGSVYDMDAATNDTTRMLSDRSRHGEKLPLVLLLGTGSTEESADGLGLLGVYDAERVVVDPRAGDSEVADSVETMVNPDATPGASTLTTGALAATLAATVNADVEDDVSHLPAISYWEDTPAAFSDLATDAGYDETHVSDLRAAISLEAFYQQYEDKRELVADLLFEDDGDLASHVGAQFHERLDKELKTGEANIETHDVDGETVRVLDADAFAHRYDFPPVELLADELHRRHGGRVVVLGDDDLYVRAEEDVDVRAVAERAGEDVPDAAVSVSGVREGRIEYLTGRRSAVQEAVLSALAAAA